MTTSRPTGLDDPEVVDLLRHDPDLLALAEAVAETQRPDATRRRALPAAAAVAAAALVAAGLLALARGGPSLTDRALAAIGGGRVVHVVARWDAAGSSVVDIASGRERPTRLEDEVWFDPARGLERTVVRADGRVLDEELQTPDGTWDSNGRVWTCATIAAHPAEATKARVSCNASGDNGTVPRQVPERRPALDPALAGFVDGYVDALRTGAARDVGPGTLDGRPIEWLEFDAHDAGRVERVAVDRRTGKPLRLETRFPGGAASQQEIVLAETIAPSAVSFARPPLAPPLPRIGSVLDPRTVSLEDAARALPGMLSLGAGLAGRTLDRVELDRLATGYGSAAGLAPTSRAGVQLAYGDDVVVKEARQAFAYGFVTDALAPPDGSLVLRSIAGPGGGHVEGLLRRNGLEVLIEAPDRSLLLEAARGLAPVGG